MKLMGYQKYSGDFEGRAYSGYYLWTQNESRQNVVGNAYDVHKVSTDVFNSFLTNFGGAPEKCIGADVLVAYNRGQDKPYMVSLIGK